MHGRPRKPLKPVDEVGLLAKADKLRALQSDFISNHQNKIYTKEAVELSAKLLEINPELYTAWNYRKLAVDRNLALAQSESHPDSIESILDVELTVVEKALKQNYKSYGAWHHRKWVLSKGHSSVDTELELLDNFQSKDARNFHAWNYRRFVAALMKRSDEDELQHTQNLIEKNLSNYSAWHNRSVLLTNLMNKKAQGFTNREEVLTREYELVREALFTDEDDQSGWFYHLWLLGQTVRSEYPILVSSWPIHGSDITLPAADCLSGCASPVNLFSFSSKKFPLILYFNESVEGVNSSTVSVSDGLSSTTGLIWKPLSVSDSSQSAKVWATHFDLPDRDTDSSKAYQVEVKVGHSPGIVSSICVQYHCPCQVSFQLHVQNSKLESGEGSSSGRMQWEDDCFSLYEPGSAAHDLIDLLDNLRIKNGPELTTSPWQERILDEETSIFRELLDCKIGKLTLARLLTAYDLWRPFDKPVHSKEILELYSELMKLDPPHRQYYKDNHSLVLLQQVTSSRESLLSHCYNYCDSTLSNSVGPLCLRLNKLAISQLGSFEKLLWVQVLDLSNNELQSIKGMEAMQLLSCLCLSNNKLRSFSALEPLRHLTSLRVLDVSDNEIGAHSIDTTRYQFCSPLSHSVGSDWHSNDMSCSEYWEAYFTLKDTRLTQIDVVGNAIASESFSLFLEKVLPTLKWLDGVQVK
ncbi:Geranylgeranyl transferase type-2 subunit alpha 1 [Linum perenne]